MKWTVIIAIVAAVFLQTECSAQTKEETPVTGEKQSEAFSVPESVVSEITELFRKQNSYFSDGKAKEIAEQNAETPFWIASDDEVRVLKTTAEVEAFFKDYTARLREHGYDHSEMLDLKVRLFNSRSAMADMTFRRFRIDGSVMGRQVRQASYMVFRTEERWKISAMIGNQPQDRAESGEREQE